jgi:YVTN family beta-propeller protein
MKKVHHQADLKARFVKSTKPGCMIAKFILTAFIFISFKSFGQSVPAKSLLALSKADHVLAVIDPVTLKVIARIPVGSDPHEVIASADGKTAWVTI